MKHCEYTLKELIPLYMDQELSNEDILLVDTHILECEDCRLELELYRSIHEELSLDDVQLPEHFHEALMGKLSLEHEAKVINAYQTTFYKKYMRYINLVALFTVVVIIGLAGLNRPTKSDMDVATMESTMEAATESTMEPEIESTMEAASVLVEEAKMENKSFSDTMAEENITSSESTEESELVDARVAIEESTPSEKDTESTSDVAFDEEILDEKSSVMTYGVTEEPSLSTEARPSTLIEWFQSNRLLASSLIFMLFILLAGLIGGIIYVKKRK